MKIKKLSKSEKQTRKYKNYNILNSYSVYKGINEIDVSKLTYDKYLVGYFNNDKITIIKNKKDNGIVKFEALEDGEYILYAKDYNRLLMLLSIFIFMLMMVVGKAAYSNIPIIKDTIEDIYLDVTKKDVPTVPKVKTDDNSKNNSWSKESIIYVTGASDAYSGIKYYEYCIRDDKNFNKCKWIKTKTQSVKITESGEHYVVFRGVSKRGEKGKISDPIKVLIDNDTPVIEEIIIDGNKVTIKATDDHSGIKEYYYKLDDGEYAKVDSEFEIPTTGLHNITIKVVDKAGNYIEVEKTIVIPEKKDLKYEEISNNSDTELTEEQKRELKKWITLNLYYPEESTDRMYLILNPIELKDGYVANEWINYEHPITVRIEDVNKIYIKYMLNGDEIIEGPNGEITIHKAPKINLDKVPSNLYYGDTYELPSYYWFDEDGGNVECKLDLQTLITNTSEIPTGIHLISCTAASNNGLKATVRKEVTVSIDKKIGLIDGWIRMNLYYPEGSTDWEWMIQNPSEIRSGYEANTWTPYTEPILVKLSDVENVYIRYKLGDKVYIVPANGKLLVNIEPDRYVLNSEETTNVKINFDEEAEVKEYRMNYGEWTTYTSDFEAPVNSLIEARVIKNVKVYDSNGNYSHTTKKQDTDAVFISERVYASSTPETTQTSSGLSVQYLASNNLLGSQGEYISSPASLDNIYRLAGPIISSNPSNEIVENTQVTVIPQEEAEKIYISVDYNSYKEYTVPITVDKNCVVRAYYIRKSDGFRSEETYYRVSNIYEPSLPYVRIDTNPTNYLSEKVDKVTVTISGQNYDKLEYSYNGKLYYEYKEPIEVTQSSTIYARGINDVGEKIEKLTITTENPPIKKGELDVSISLNPDYTNKEGLLNETIVTIDYDIRAEKKYYRLGNGETREYTGPFKLRENTTIYAYGESSNRYGESKKIVDFLTTGINSPDIITNTDDLTDEVEVSINYARNAEVKKYKIDNGNWITYTGTFTVYENCTIYAYNEDILGNKNTSSKVINNITYIPKYTVLDEGTYFLLKLNYPDSSSKDTREYKWTPQGEWKVYDDKGILLIDYSQKGKVETSDGVKVRDRNGNEITMTDHYYFTDLYNVNLEENLFMRFNARKPDTPQIKLDTYDATKVSKVSIIYDFSIGPKLYKIVNGNEESEWLEYEGPFEIEKNNTIIYAKNQNSAEKWSDIASYKIVNIDDIKPTVSYDADFETPKQRVTIQIKANDNLGIDKVGYIKGQHDEKSCRENAEFIRNYTTFNVSENGIYTICAIDNVGNVTTKEIEITNIDLTAPDIEINDLSTEFSNESEIEIDFGDSTFKQYRIGTTGEWINYTGKFTIKANDVLDKANEDFTLTIYAKGKDSAGNEQVVSEKLYSIDLDAPSEPVINASTGKPVLTLYGVEYDDILTVNFDNTRDDIKNYISLDNGKTWKIYSGVEKVHSGTVIAKSVKTNSGLTISTTKEISLPQNCLNGNAYDGNDETSVQLGLNLKYLYIDESTYNHTMIISTIQYDSRLDYYFYDKNGNVLDSYTKDWDRLSGNQKISLVIPENADRIGFYWMHADINGYGYVNISNIEMDTTPAISSTKYYPILTEYGVTQGYNEVTVSYYPTAVRKLYKINSGNWMDYENSPIKLNIGDKIYVKSVDKNSTESMQNSYTMSFPNDGLGNNAYNNNKNNYVTLTNGAHYLYIDETVYNEKIRVYTIQGDAALNWYIYDKDGNVLDYWDTDGTKAGGRLSGEQITTIDIPEGSYKISLFWRRAYTNGYGYINVWNIDLITKGKINKTKNYPTIKSTGIEPGNNMITLDYYRTAVDKYYKIDSQNWTRYNNDEIRLEIDQTIYTKSNDKNGKELEQNSYKAVLPSNALGANAYNGNSSNSDGLANWLKYLYIDESMYNQQIKVYSTQRDSALNWYTYDKDGNVLDYWDTDGTKYGGRVDGNCVTTIDIPMNAYKIGIFWRRAYNGGYGWINVWNVETVIKNPIYSSPKSLMGTRSITQVQPDTSGHKKLEYETPKINYNDGKISITYPQGYRNEYSFDANEWISYENEIDITENKVIFARTVDENGKVISSSSLNITTIPQEETKEEENNEQQSTGNELSDRIKQGEDIKLEGLCTANDEELTNISSLQPGNYHIICKNEEVIVLEKDIEIYSEE